MKFDCIVGNPPYDVNLHLKVIDKAIRMLDGNGKGCFIHPARWLQDPLWKWKPNCDRKKFGNITDRMVMVEMIDGLSVNSLFGIHFNGDLMVSFFENGTSPEVVVYDSRFYDVFNVVIPYVMENNIGDRVDTDRIDGWRCEVKRVLQLATINGRNDEYTRNIPVHIVPRISVFFNGYHNGTHWTKVRAKGGKTKYRDENTLLPFSVSFNTREEADNFHDSCRTNFFKNWVYMVKFDMHTPLNFLPWMGDYNHAWTDEDYCEFFGKLGMSKECQEWMCRDVYDYRIKDFVEYVKI